MDVLNELMGCVYSGKPVALRVDILDIAYLLVGVPEGLGIKIYFIKV